MITREELLKTEEYWFETIQNDIYRAVADHIEKEGINQTQLAEKLGVSKGYISQIMNGNFNYTLKKLIELSLAVGRAPVLELKLLDEIVKPTGKDLDTTKPNMNLVAESAGKYKKKTGSKDQ